MITPTKLMCACMLTTFATGITDTYAPTPAIGDKIIDTVSPAEFEQALYSIRTTNRIVKLWRSK